MKSSARMAACAVVAAALGGMVGCGAAPDDSNASVAEAPLHTVSVVRVGPKGQRLVRSAELTHKEFLAMNARRDARQHGLPVPAMPSRSSGDIGEVSSAIS